MSRKIISQRHDLHELRGRRALGMLCGIGAAVAYGTNLLGALKLYAVGMPTGCVLFYRFSLAFVLMGIVLWVRGENLFVTRRELAVVTLLGLLFSASSLTLYLSFHYIEAGVASTILFVYPVITAAIMAVFFKEKITWNTVVSILLAMVGVVLLYWTGSTGRLSTAGVVLVLISALTYAVYIVTVDRARLSLSAFKINFYVLFYCALSMVVYSLVSGQPLMWPPTAESWFYVGWLALVPAILALVLMVYAAKYVGSTTTAVLGALEPLTAVVLGIVVFGESFSARLAVGIVFVLSAVVVIALGRKPEENRVRNESV